jgi:cytochrome-b5 reductase
MGGGTSLPTAAPQDSKVDSDTQNKGKPSNSAFLGGDQGWIDLKLESVEELSHNTKKFRFALPNEDDISGLHIASALLTKYKGPEMEKVGTFPSVVSILADTAQASNSSIYPNERRRLVLLNLSSSSRCHTYAMLDAQGHIDFIVKKYADGPMSSHFHDMNVEQRMDFKGPIPKYPWQPNKHDHICLIAGGTGITP